MRWDMNKELELAKIARTIQRCAACRKGKTGNPVPGEGSPDARVVFVGEAPGRQEAAVGRPFIGRSGQLLRSLIRKIGLLEKDVFITSPVKYLPDSGTPSRDDIAHGRIHLSRQIAVIGPQIIVLLGRVAVQAVLEQSLQVTKIHGESIERNGAVHFITLHPAAAVRLKKLQPVLESDFRKLEKLLFETQLKATSCP